MYIFSPNFKSTAAGFLILMVYHTITSDNGNKLTENFINKEEQIVRDTFPRVTGIGGVFFYSENPSQTTDWYQKNLGIKTDAYGAVFEFRNAINPGETNYLRWSPSKDFANSGSNGNQFMVNYRVQNLAGLVRNLKASGVSIQDTIASYPYGKFIHIKDIDGRIIELWEPVDSVLTKMGGVTNK